ncbi:hypothetical protein K438DRAFT_1747368 [Mycena galopus ATCC 62051]|nr:hypothetical protein K438DRAFT_1747368 [Mycena galopus ATCC 62051]
MGQSFCPARSSIWNEANQSPTKMFVFDMYLPQEEEDFGEDDVEVYGIDWQGLCDDDVLHLQAQNNSSTEGSSSWVGHTGPPPDLSQVIGQPPMGTLAEEEATKLYNSFSHLIGSAEDGDIILLWSQALAYVCALYQCGRSRMIVVADGRSRMTAVNGGQMQENAAIGWNNMILIAFNHGLVLDLADLILNLIILVLNLKLQPQRFMAIMSYFMLNLPMTNSFIHDGEMPLDFLQQRLVYHSFLYMEEEDGICVVNHILATSPDVWDGFINSRNCPNIFSLMSTVHRFSASLMSTWNTANRTGGLQGYYPRRSDRRANAADHEERGESESETGDREAFIAGNPRDRPRTGSSNTNSRGCREEESGRGGDSDAEESSPIQGPSFLGSPSRSLVSRVHAVASQLDD